MDRVNWVFCIFAGLILAFLGFRYLDVTREKSRVNYCQERLRELAVATQYYVNSNGHLPSGTLGQVDGVSYLEWKKVDGSLAWNKVQNTSALPQVFKYYDKPSFNSGLPEFVFDINAQGMEGMTWERYQKMLIDDGFAVRPELAFVCPADNVNQDKLSQATCITTQPIVDENSGDGNEKAFDDLGVELWSLSDKPIGRTNFLANGGVSGGWCNLSGGRLSSYIGPMRSRSKVIPDQIPDGKSVTFLFGETLGEIVEGTRVSGHSWFLGGVGVARGPLFPIECLDAERLKTAKLLGNNRSASRAGFASRHLDGVNFAMVGGEFGIQSKSIDPVVLYAFAGISDSVDKLPNIPPDSLKK